MESKKVKYEEGGVTFEAYVAYDEKQKGKTPLVLVAHDWRGRGDFACQKADELAKLGYTAFAIDLYGNAKTGSTTEENQKLMQPLTEDRNLLQKRLLASYNTAKSLPMIDSSRIGAIGFCFGGLCVIDLARTGIDLKGVVSFHGLLKPPPSDVPQSTIKAKILVLQGYEDPMVSAKDIEHFQTEMTKAQVDWQMHIYSHTQHGFTNPIAHDTKLGIIYNELAARRSWQEMKDFFVEIF